MQVIVKSALEKYPQYRDDDNRLVSYIWWSELKKQNVSTDKMSGTEFLHLYASSKLPQADVITRARRKVQEDNMHLRGELYDERHEQQKKVRKDI